MTSRVQLPELSHLQIAVLGFLGAEAQRGAGIRSHLGSLSVHQTGPAFYQMMARLEEAGLAEGWERRKGVGGRGVSRWSPTAGSSPRGGRRWRVADSARHFRLPRYTALLGRRRRERYL